MNLNGKPILNVPGMHRFKLNYAAHKAGNQQRTPFPNMGGAAGYGQGGFQSRSSSRTNHSVYVGNLAQNISNKALFDLFSTKVGLNVKIWYCLKPFVSLFQIFSS